MVLEATNAEGMNALHWAANKGQLDLVKYLLGKGAALETVDINGDDALHHAAISGSVEVAAYFLE